MVAVSSLLRTVLVVGATGKTGRHVVQMLLDEGHTVKAVVRSKERMQDMIRRSKGLLELTEASFLDLPMQQVEDLVQDCDAIVSCLGHSGSFSGVWGPPYHLVKDSVERLCEAAAKVRSYRNTKSPRRVVVLGTVLVPAPNEPKRSWGDRMFLSVLRSLLPPHVDNEAVVEYLLDHQPSIEKDSIEWCVVRPNLLVDAEQVGTYRLRNHCEGGIFTSKATSKRIHVAHAMTQLATDKERAWEQWKFQMPVLFDDED